MSLLTQRAVERQHLPNALLRAFDGNIVRHTMAINGRRAELIRWRYDQYTALLFTEIYLHHLQQAGRRHELNKIILLTPKEELSLEWRCFKTKREIPATEFQRLTKSDLVKTL